MMIKGESMDTCFIVPRSLSQIVKGKNLVDIIPRSQAINAVVYGDNNIKSAFDMALYDIAAQH